MNNPAKEAMIAEKLQGLQPGRIVNYVVDDVTIRPMMVVRVGAGNRAGVIAGHVYRDVANDHQIDSRGRDAIAWVESASFSENHEPETWHWPARG